MHRPLEASIPFTLLAAVLALTPSTDASAQVYGYTDDKGVLTLSNVPTEDRMRLIDDGTPEEAGRMLRYSGQYDEFILRASQLYGVDATLVRAVIAVESAFNRYARSHKGARGLMQLMPATARLYGVGNVYDPWQNIRGGTAYLKEQMSRFNDIRLALAAYNAGPTAVTRYNGIPPYRETRNYVRKVMALYRGGSRIQIVKGDKVYSIGQPGGSTRVTQFHQGSGQPSAVRPSTFAAMALRAGRASSVRTSEVRPTATPRAQPQAAGATASTSATPSYFRYVDAEGVVHITRTPPSGSRYDVLAP